MPAIGDDEVCERLHMEDREEDPTDCLFDLAGSLLLRSPDDARFGVGEPD